MTVISQEPMINSAYPARAAIRGLAEDNPPVSYDVVPFDYGSGNGIIPFNGDEAFVYVKAEGSQVNVKFYGRLRLRNTDGDEITGDWAQIGSTINQTAASSGEVRYEAADLVPGYNEFKLEWEGGGAGSQVGFTIK